MPIFITEKETKWIESEDKMLIIIPLKSRIDVNPSVLITTKYLKVRDDF